MKIKISRWKILIDNELKRLYEGKSIKVWMAEYNYSGTPGVMDVFTDKSEMPPHYSFKNVEEFDVIIKSITCHGKASKYVKICIDPVQYQGRSIDSFLMSNRILNINE